MGVGPPRTQEDLSETTLVRCAVKWHRVGGRGCDVPGELPSVQYVQRT